MNTGQLCLFDLGPPRAPDPPAVAVETSKAAAEQIKPDAATLRGIVLQLIVERAEHGATDEEIQRGLGLSGDTERPRRWELEKAGLVRDSGQRRRTSSGREATVWVAVGMVR